MDEAARLLGPWLQARAAEVDASAWFFIRYFDMTGQHLRLRLHCDADDVDRLYERSAELNDMVRDIRTADVGQRLVPGAAALGRPGVQRVRATLYSPELQKYGGEEGVRLAERLFTASTRWYVEQDVGALNQVGARAALAVRFLRQAVTVAMPGREAEFWAAHRRHWGWHLRSAVPTQQGFQKLLTSTRIAITRTDNDIGDPVGRIDDHVAEVVATLNAADAAGVVVSRMTLLLNYLHMDMNRWGFLPSEECLLGLLVATAQKGEAGTVGSASTEAGALTPAIAP